MTITYPDSPLAFRVRIAPGADVLTEPDTWPWQEVTEDVSFRKDAVFNLAAGTQDEQQESETSLQLVFRNHVSAYVSGAGRYTSDNANSDLWPYFDVGLPIEFAIDPGDGWHVLAIEFLGDAAATWPGGSSHVAIVTCNWAGLLRRLQNRQTSKSPYFRAFTSETDNRRPLHYWPVEQDAAGVHVVTRFGASPKHVATTFPLRTSPVLPGTEQGPPVSKQLPLFAWNDSIRATVTNDGNIGNTNGHDVHYSWGFIFKGVIGATSGTVAPCIMLQAPLATGDFVDGGTPRIPALVLTLAGKTTDGIPVPGAAFIKATLYNAGSATAASEQYVYDMFDGRWHSILFEVFNDSSGSNTAFTQILVDGQLPPGYAGTSGVVGNIAKPSGFTIGPANAAIATTVDGTAVNNNAAQLTWSIGHVYYTDESAGTPFPYSFSGDSRVFYAPTLAGERAIDRWARICSEEGILGPTDMETLLFPITAPMGEQAIDSAIPVLRQVEASDRAALVDRLGRLTLVSLSYMVNAESDLTVDGASLYGPTGNRGQLPRTIAATTDDLHVINDVAISRDDGGVTQIQDVADIARRGRYDGQLSVSTVDFRSARGQAGWSIRTGVAAGVRYATLTVDLLRNPELIAPVLALLEAKPPASDPDTLAGISPMSGIGRRITLVNLPNGSAPGPVDVQVRGWTMAIVGRQAGWTITFNLVPYWPYEVFVIESDGGTGGDYANRSRLASGRDRTTGAARSALGTAVDTDDTTLQVLHLQSGYRWDIDDVGSGFGLLVDGEPMLCTAIADYLRDDFNRSVTNGVGTPTVGPAYALSSASTEYNVSNTGTSRAIITPTTAGSDRSFWASIDTPNAVMMGDFRCTNALPATSGGYRMGMTLRRDTVGASHDHYIAEIIVSNTGVIRVRVLKRVSGSLSVLSGGDVTLPWTYSVGLWIRIMAYINGTSIKVKAWPRDTTIGGNTFEVRPWPNWFINLTDSSVPASAGTWQWGANLRSDDGTTTKIYEVDNLRMLTPQAFTVTRSITGVVRSHAVGAEVDLFRPAAISLGGRITGGGL